MSTNPHVGRDEHGAKVFLPLENNPAILNPLAHSLGLSPSLAFHDLYSFTEPELINLVPRPALALLFVWPCTKGAMEWWEESCAEEKKVSEGNGEGWVPPVLWFRQDIRECCGLMGLIHCALNVPDSLSSLLPSSITIEPTAPPTSSTNVNTNGTSAPSPTIIQPSSILHSLSHTAALHPTQSPSDILTRASLITHSPEIETLHTAAALQGSTAPLRLHESPGHAFIAFVKDGDNNVWEMDGARGGPRFLGSIGPGEDLLSEGALRLGPLAYVERELARSSEERGGEGAARVRGLDFSCTVLAPTVEG